LDVFPEALEGTSFWDLICEDSVRLLKAAFMDSLAARDPDSDTALLGSGVWELRLKNKDSKYMLVTLNGVVHFKGEAPECVCCIRPLRSEQQQQQQQSSPQSSKRQVSVTVDGSSNININVDGVNDDDGSNNKDKNNVSCSDGDASRTSDGSNGTQQQSVLSRINPSGLSIQAQDEVATEAKHRNKKFRRMMHHQADEEADNKKNNHNHVINGGEADGTNNSVRISDGDIDSLDGLDSDESN